MASQSDENPFPWPIRFEMNWSPPSPDSPPLTDLWPPPSLRSSHIQWPFCFFKMSFHPRDFEFLIFSSLFPHYSNLGPNVTLSERPRVTSASWWPRHFPYIVLKASRPGKPHNLKPSRTVGHPWVLHPKYPWPSHPELLLYHFSYKHENCVPST